MKKYTRGHVREDGMVFIRYKYGKEVWGTQERYDKQKKHINEYAKNCYRLAKSRMKTKRLFGDYNATTGLYYIGLSSSGKEIWRNKEYYLKFKSKVYKAKRKYIDKCYTDFENNNLKPGMKHPDNPKLYVLYKVGNRCFFGSKAELLQKKESCRLAELKQRIKNKTKRRELLSDIENKKKRGDTRSIDNKIFFYYSDTGREIWLDPEVFHARRSKEIERKKKRREKLKSTSDSKSLNPQQHVDSISSNSINDQK